MLLNIFLLIIGLATLIAGGELLVKSAIKLALRFNISILVAGSTIVAFATSAPELVVSIYAALNDTPAISMGNVVGSNICNFGLIMGVTALLRPVYIQKSAIKFDWTYMMFASILLYVFVLDQHIMFYEGIIFLVGLAVFTWYLVYDSQKNGLENASELEGIVVKKNKRDLLKQIGLLMVSIFALYLGSQWFVTGAINIAAALGISDRIIAITLVALGTSLPELITALVAIYRKETDIAVGNVIGSNIFNIFSILGITSLIQTIYVEDKFLQFDLWWMLGISFVLFPLVVFTGKLKRWGGLVLVSLYVAYIYLVVG